MDDLHLDPLPPKSASRCEAATSTTLKFFPASFGKYHRAASLRTNPISNQSATTHARQRGGHSYGRHHAIQ